MFGFLNKAAKERARLEMSDPYQAFETDADLALRIANIQVIAEGTREGAFEFLHFAAQSNCKVAKELFFIYKYGAVQDPNRNFEFIRICKPDLPKALSVLETKYSHTSSLNNQMLWQVHGMQNDYLDILDTLASSGNIDSALKWIVESGQLLYDTLKRNLQASTMAIIEDMRWNNAEEFLSGKRHPELLHDIHEVYWGDFETGKLFIKLSSRYSDIYFNMKDTAVWTHRINNYSNASGLDIKSVIDDLLDLPARTTQKVHYLSFRKMGDKFYQIGVWENYEAYLNSEVWAILRKRALDRDYEKCVVCSREAKNVHHKKYPRILGSEDIKLLASVRDRCHKTYHHMKDVLA